MASRDFIDKVWFFARNKGSPSGTQRVVMLDHRNGQELATIPLPTGGDWALDGFVNCRRFPLPGTGLPEELLDFIKIHVSQEAGHCSRAHVAIWLTKSTSNKPLAVWHCHSYDLTLGQRCELSKTNPQRIKELTRIDLLAETSRNQPGWLWGGSPNQFMFVVTTNARGLVLSEVFPYGTGQRMEASETALFQFALPITISYADFSESGRMVIKAKGNDSWYPRHILALGSSDADPSHIQILGGCLNIDKMQLTTEAGSGMESLLEIPRWVSDEQP